MHKVVQYFAERQQEYVGILKSLVELESPSNDPVATGRLLDLIADLLFRTGGVTDCSRFANHLVARWGQGPKQVLVLGHADTVWPLGEVEQRPFRVENDRAWGPGSHDMKGSLAMAILVMKCVKDMQFHFRRPVTVMINGDEEVGSPSSRMAIEQEAANSSAVLVLEPPGPNGELKTERKGVGLFTVDICSASTQSCEDEKSVIPELARVTKKLHSLTSPTEGIYVNVGVVRGGYGRKFIAAEAQAEVDLRVPSMVSARRLEEIILHQTAEQPGVAIKVTGGLNRPPMERTQGTLALFHTAQMVAEQIGLRVDEMSAGGASDGNFTAALGVPTLDGLGVPGSGGHSLHEYVDIKAFPERAALLCGILTNFE